jgi:hypothetical protein
MVPIKILNQIDKYRRHYLWRGGYINSKKPPLAAWKLVTKPKIKGGLGVINPRLQNDTLLLKICTNSSTKQICHGSIFFGINTVPLVMFQEQSGKENFGR